MQYSASSHQRTAALDADLGSRLGVAVIAALIGAFILLGVGFAQPEVLHNAAHDARHAFAFPCH